MYFIIIIKRNVDNLLNRGPHYKEETRENVELLNTTSSKEIPEALQLPT